MAPTPRNRRSYGFNGASGEPTKKRPVIKKRPVAPPKKSASTRAKRSTQRTSGAQSPLRTLLHGFMSLLIACWRVFSFVWKKRPTLSKDAKRYVRSKMISLIVLLVALGFVGGTIIVAWASKDLPDPNRLTDRQVAQSTKIFDRTGEHLLYEIFADEKRTIIELEDVSEYVIQGVIATEDTKFYEHKGIRPLSILRAVFKGLLPGNRIAGTSTLTQQLVKNAILTNERSIVRKIKEAILSIRLEQKYTKNQILKIYFNEIPYGSTNYGIESAAQSYFGKSASELDLQESATLAGLPKAPSTYLNNPEALKKRRNFVLRRMFDEGHITEVEKNTAQAMPVTLSRNYGEIKAPHFVLHVREQLVEQFGESLVDSGGLKVLTTLDWDAQQRAERLISEHATTTLVEAEADNMAMVAMNPNTGEILSMVGSADFYNDDIDGQFNVATLGKRQPGSSFKPIIYTAAFEQGYTPETILYDVATDFGANSSKSYKPLNYNLKEIGPVTMQKALQGSLNIPAVKALYLVGDKAGVDFAGRLGYSTLENGDFGLSLVLGGGEVLLLDHANAYSVFANGGTYREPVTILSVEDPSGDMLHEWKVDKGERVLEEAITDTISAVLSNDEARAYAFGANGILTIGDRPVAAKTGTTNAYVDAWTIGYTPSLVVGVWAGNTDNTPMKPGFGGGRVAGPVWNAFMRETLAGTPVETFNPAPEIDTNKPVLRGTADGGVRVQVNKITGNLISSSTPEHLIEERIYVQPHSILHYVQKDNPQGPEPKNPADDAQYEIWEAAILEWVERMQEEDPDFKLEFGEAPTKQDDEYSLELIPSLTVVLPQASSTLTSRNISTDIRVLAPRGVSKVTYKINTAFVGVVRDHPFNLNYYAGNLADGDHTLTILVEDDVGNRLEEVIPFTLAAGPIPPAIVWRNGNQTVSSRATLILAANIFNQDAIESATITATDSSGNTRTLVASVDFSSVLDSIAQIRADDNLPKGDWTVQGTVQTKNGESLAIAPMRLTIK